LSREIKEFRVPTPLTRPEGNIAGGAIREASADPARSENLCMYGISMRENREVPRSPAQMITGGSLREGQGRKPEMHEGGKSDSPVVPAKPLNMAGSPAAEVVEERGLAKGNTGSVTRPGTEPGKVRQARWTVCVR